jgi:hypothetical protein
MVGLEQMLGDTGNFLTLVKGQSWQLHFITHHFETIDSSLHNSP